MSMVRGPVSAAAAAVVAGAPLSPPQAIADTTSTAAGPIRNASRMQYLIVRVIQLVFGTGSRDHPDPAMATRASPTAARVNTRTATPRALPQSPSAIRR